MSNFVIKFHESNSKVTLGFHEHSKAFDINFHESNSKFMLGFHDHTKAFDISFGEVSILPNAEVYSESYVATPTVDSQIFPTADKFMKHDFTVNAIPYFSVSNLSGGNTVYIGNEV